MIKDWANPLSSFRARILIFVTAIVLTTIVALYSISRHLEQRLAGLVAEHVKAISVSVDLAQSSFPSGEYIHDLLREDGRITVGMEENHIIHKIIVVDANDRVIIRELANAALRVSSGDFDFSVPTGQRDEMGALAGAFNKMLAGLREKRELEVRLQRVERAALTGRIAAGIAHEIRNPLNFINLTIDFIRDKFAPAAETARADYTKLCDSVKDELARLNRMVSDFLSYGRPARLRLREVNARGLIEEVMDLVRAQADQQGVSLSVMEEAGDGGLAHDGHFKGDAEQLKTCFSNLAINAVQAMAGGGALKITLRPQKRNIRFEVADSGPGIEPEALGQIFEPYFSTKETGIGLGLALTRKLIEDHGGQIMVSSEVGVGTTFMVILPREPVSEPHPATSTQPVLSES
jgi:signal transduction histidine kinase